MYKLTEGPLELCLFLLSFPSLPSIFGEGFILMETATEEEDTEFLDPLFRALVGHSERPS